MSRLIEEKKITGVLASADINAGIDCDSINIKNASHAAFICVFGPSYAGANGAVLKLYSGATDGTKTTAMTFSYRYGGAAIKSANADDYTAEATSAALQVATATLVSRVLVIEVDTADMTDGHNWLTLEVGAEATGGELTVVAVCDPRYMSPADDTILT